MVIKAEIFEGNALLLDDSGRVWSVQIGSNLAGHPEVKLLMRIDSASITRAMQPTLARYAGR